MARCTICKKNSNEIQLCSGILGVDMVMICEECARAEEVPIIKKPSELQLSKADKRYSVRERMERISGMNNEEKINNNQIVTQGNLAKLRMPQKKQYHEDVLDNYYWTLNIARRRAKLSIKQLSELIKIDANILQSIEKGSIPENFREICLKLEAFLGIKLLKNHKKKLSFIRTQDEEREILNNVKEKLNPKSHDIEDATSQINDSEQTKQYKKKNRLEKLSNGEIDFSRREDLSDITLDDLVSIKKERESKLARRKTKASEDAMLGDDLDLEFEEL